MEFDFRDHEGIGVAVVSGQVDATSAPTLMDGLTGRIDEGWTEVVADLSALEYSSSAGLRALLAAVKHARRAGGDFRVAAVQDRVARVLEMSGFDQIIRTYDTVDAAVASFAS